MVISSMMIISFINYNYVPCIFNGTLPRWIGYLKLTQLKKITEIMWCGMHLVNLARLMTNLFNETWNECLLIETGNYGCYYFWIDRHCSFSSDLDVSIKIAAPLLTVQKFTQVSMARMLDESLVVFCVMGKTFNRLTHWPLGNLNE